MTDLLLAEAHELPTEWLSGSRLNCSSFLWPLGAPEDPERVPRPTELHLKSCAPETRQQLVGKKDKLLSGGLAGRRAERQSSDVTVSSWLPRRRPSARLTTFLRWSRRVTELSDCSRRWVMTSVWEDGRIGDRWFWCETQFELWGSRWEASVSQPV